MPSEHSSSPAASAASTGSTRHYSAARLDELPSTEKEKPEKEKPEKDDDPTLEESESSVRDEGRPVEEDNISNSFDWILRSLGE